ncbi:unnamed protein product [Amoebophrya sp. A25]|nr:unnamed protein product [Amoebophrya sp. A25]|eukprot:GSA25T00006662001.1
MGILAPAMVTAKRRALLTEVFAHKGWALPDVTNQQNSDAFDELYRYIEATEGDRFHAFASDSDNFA